MILCELSLEQAVSACAVRGKYRGHTRGTRSTRRVLHSLGVTLHRVSNSQVGLRRGSTLKDLERALRNGALPSGRYLVSSKRKDDAERDEIGHVSAIVDGQLMDGKGNIAKPLRITAIRRVEGDLRRAKSNAARDAKTIRPEQQPVAIGKLSRLYSIFARRHRVAPKFGPALLHPNGRRKRADTIVEWYPLLVASQPRATFSSNVRSLVLGLQHVLKADFNSLRPVLIDRAGRQIHGNTRVRSVARRGPRGRPVRRLRPS